MEIVYVPLSEETLALIEELKQGEEDVDAFIRNLLGQKIFQRDIELLQREKMGELWDNPSDGRWDEV